MEEVIFYIYIAAVLTFTLLPSDVRSVTCEYPDSSPVGEICYRPNYNDVSWTDGRDNCKRWNGKLATFTSLDRMAEIFEALKIKAYMWIAAQDGSEAKGFQWAAYYTPSGADFFIYPEICTDYLFSRPTLCVEMYNSTPGNYSALKTATTTPPNIDLSSKPGKINIANHEEKCLHKDSVPDDGQCYRSSTEMILWSNATNYCNIWNATLASFASITQGYKIMTAMRLIDYPHWVSDYFNKDKPTSVAIENSPDEKCQFYRYSEYLNGVEKEARLKALCVELPLTPSFANKATTTPGTFSTTKLTTTPKMTNTRESTTTLKSTTRPKSTTETKMEPTTSIATKLAIAPGTFSTTKLITTLKMTTTIDYYTKIDYKTRINYYN